MHYNVLQIQKEDTEYLDPKESACENTVPPSDTTCRDPWPTCPFVIPILTLSK